MIRSLSVLLLILKPCRESALLHRKSSGRGRLSCVIPGSWLPELVATVLDIVG